jgi:hypothetical protein
MQDDQRNLFTIVLAGQLELARRLEHPKRANLLQRIGTFCRIDKIESENLLKTYVETRLKLAGGTKNIFTDGAYGFLWEYSEHGVPRLINKICKLSLKAGETNQFNEIGGEVVRQIGERFRNLAGHAVQKRKPRKRHESKVIAEPVHEKSEVVTVEPGVLSVEAFQDRRRTAESLPVKAEQEEKPEATEEVQPAEAAAASDLHAYAQVVETARPAGTVSAAVEASKPVVQAAEEPMVPKPAEEPTSIPKELLEEMEMYGYKIAISIPVYLIEQAQSATPEYRMKVAGVLAAQVLKKQPELTSSPSVDPISVWSDIREFILTKLR